jgi:hypothetical protein
MRVFYLDAGLTGNVGHHANHCRYIVDELRARAIDVQVFAFAGIESTLRTELAAIPHFRSYTYWEKDFDPICGWLSDFQTAVAVFREDLSHLPEPACGDLIYLSAVSPAQLLAVTDWYDSMRTDRRPAVVLELITSDLELALGEQGLEVTIPDPRKKSRPTLFRFAAKRLRGHDRSRFHLVTYTRTYADLFGMLLETDVQTVPFPYRAVTQLRNRAAAHPITVSVLGHQRLEKGYAALPEILSLLLRSRWQPDVRILVQAVSIRDPSDAQSDSGSPETDAALCALAASDDRLSVDQRSAGKRRWPELLRRSDLVLCANGSPDSLAAVSAVAAEAMANGIPIVAPDKTEIAKLLAECGGGGTFFNGFEPGTIVRATRHALDNFNHYATLAYQGALLWREAHGPTRLVEALLKMVDEPSVAVNPAEQAGAGIAVAAPP